MKFSLLLITILVFVVFSCSSTGKSIKGVSKIADTKKSEQVLKKFSISEADSILRKYTLEFSIPNPLYGEDTSAVGRRFDPSHTSTISVWARLLDDFSTEADIVAKCKKDSLSENEYSDAVDKYRQENRTGKMFRILLFMESGFSEKSLDPSLWSIYIENSKGVTIEPADIKTGPVTSLSDSVYNNMNDRFVGKKVFRRSITLYFNKNTFYGENLLGDNNTHVILAFSREQKKVIKVAWKISSSVKK